MREADLMPLVELLRNDSLKKFTWSHFLRRAKELDMQYIKVRDMKSLVRSGHLTVIIEEDGTKYHMVTPVAKETS